MHKSALRGIASLVSVLSVPFVGWAADPVRDAFGELGYHRTLLDFPHNRQLLDSCFQSKDESCLRALGMQRRAALVLFGEGPAVALNRTLSVLGKECGSMEPRNWSRNTTWRVCAGAIQAFYFFSTEDEDRRIVERLRGLGEPVLWKIFVECDCFGGDWLGNRPDKQRWMALIDGMKFLDKATGGRESFKDLFRLYVPVPDSGIGLVDPRVDLPKWQAGRLGVPR